MFGIGFSFLFMSKDQDIDKFFLSIFFFSVHDSEFVLKMRVQLYKAELNFFPLYGF